MVLKINEALLNAQRAGNKIYKRDLAAKLWPNSSHAAQLTNMTALSSGKTKAIRPEWVAIICATAGCSADFLFGLVTE